MSKEPRFARSSIIPKLGRPCKKNKDDHAKKACLAYYNINIKFVSTKKSYGLLLFVKWNKLFLIYLKDGAHVSSANKNPSELFCWDNVTLPLFIRRRRPCFLVSIGFLKVLYFCE